MGEINWFEVHLLVETVLHYHRIQVLLDVLLQVIHDWSFWLHWLRVVGSVPLPPALLLLVIIVVLLDLVVALDAHTELVAQDSFLEAWAVPLLTI